MFHLTERAIKLRHTVNQWLQSDCVKIFEREVRWFPVLTVLLLSIVLLCGGHCSAWQWWSCVGVTLGFGFWLGAGKGWSGLSSGLLFLLLLAGIWLLAGITLNHETPDSLAYHTPAIRMLINGWNPIYHATPEEITGVTDPMFWDCNAWHIIAMPKGAWYFAAEAWHLTHTPFSLLMPLFVFLFISAALQVWKFFETSVWWSKGFALCLLFFFAPGAFCQITDGAVFFGGIGTLAAMGCALRTKRCDWESLLLHSFWMMCGKQIGLLSCFVFWSGFSIILLWRNRSHFSRSILQLSGFGSLLLLFWGCVSVAPYGTAWWNYRHPLYPCYTSDAEHFPIHNIVYDFEMDNEDAAAMGHLGRFINAYISQGLTRKYYSWKLKKDDFSPRSQTWRTGAYGNDAASGPTRLSERLGLLVAMLLIITLGKRTEKFLCLLISLALFIVPTGMIGYTRYVPWLDFTYLIALAVLTRSALNRNVRFLRTCAATLCLILMGVYSLPIILSWSVHIDDSYTAHQLLAQGAIHSLYHAHPQGPERTTPQQAIERPGIPCGFRISRKNAALLQTQEPRLAQIPLKPLKLFGPAMADYPVFPGEPFRLNPDTRKALEHYSLFLANQKEPSRLQRFMNYPSIVLRCVTVRLGALIGWRITSLWCTE